MAKISVWVENPFLVNGIDFEKRSILQYDSGSKREKLEAEVHFIHTVDGVIKLQLDMCYFPKTTSLLITDSYDKEGEVIVANRIDLAYKARPRAIIAIRVANDPQAIVIEVDQ